MTEIATQGEAMGFDYLTMTDHVVLPDTKVPGYPYSESGEFYEEAPIERHEQLIGMAYVAAKTSRILLVAAVLVVPHRPAVLAAKMLATLDVLSGGRLVVGIGAGWLKTEFDAVVTTPFPERGAVTDEYIDAFRLLWTEHAPRFAGRYTKFDGIVLEPKPVQRPHPPIWVGGEGPAALRRAARIGNAWYPIGSNPRFPVGTPAQFAAYVARVKRYATEAGRDPSALDFAYSANWSNDQQAQTLPDGQRRPLTGTPQQIADDIKRYEELGVRHMLVNLQGETQAQTLERMRRFADRIMPLTA